VVALVGVALSRRRPAASVDGEVATPQRVKAAR